MIDEDRDREAMLWIQAFLWISNTAIQMDAPDEEKPRFQAKVDQLVSDMGLNVPQDVETRARWANELTEGVFKAADNIASRNPGVIQSSSRL